MFISWFLYVHICICKHILCISIYMYIWRNLYTHTYTYMYILISYVQIYIFIHWNSDWQWKQGTYTCIHNYVCVRERVGVTVRRMDCVWKYTSYMGYSNIHKNISININISIPMYIIVLHIHVCRVYFILYLCTLSGYVVMLYHIYVMLWRTSRSCYVIYDVYAVYHVNVMLYYLIYIWYHLICMLYHLISRTRCHVYVIMPSHVYVMLWRISPICNLMHVVMSYHIYFMLWCISCICYVLHDICACMDIFIFMYIFKCMYECTYA